MVNMSSVFLITISNIVAFCLGADVVSLLPPSSSQSESLPSLGRVFDSDAITSPVSPPGNGLGERSRNFSRAPGRSAGSSVRVDGWGKAYALGDCSRHFSRTPGRSPGSSVLVEGWGSGKDCPYWSMDAGNVPTPSSVSFPSVYSHQVTLRVNSGHVMACPSSLLPGTA